MRTYIALLRGINVGGRNRLPMSDLANLMTSINLQNVRTYIQSGNVVFQSDQSDPVDLAKKLEAAAAQRFGFTPHFFILEVSELERAMAANPFPAAETQAKSLHLYFLADAPKQPDLAKLESLRRDGEQFLLHDQRFYLYAPEGIGRSKLAAQVEKALAVPVTARNWRTIRAIMDLAKQVVV